MCKNIFVKNIIWNFNKHIPTTSVLNDVSMKKYMCIIGKVINFQEKDHC